MRTLLLDIEGTTTPISFVYDVLFPYAASRQRDFLMQLADRNDVRAAIDMLEGDARSERQKDDSCPVILSGEPSDDRARQAADVVEWLMGRDKKATGLKHLQGLLWKGGYLDGSLKGALFADVAEWLRTWHADGVRMAIYSSGSVAAQKLLFGYSEAGDLTPCFEAYFDTTIGGKKEATSYVEIAQALAVPARDILFCTDNIEEARAADAAGVSVAVSVRPGNPTLPEHDWPEVRSFEELNRLVRST